MYEFNFLKYYCELNEKCVYLLVKIEKKPSISLIRDVSSGVQYAVLLCKVIPLYGR